MSDPFNLLNIINLPLNSPKIGASCPIRLLLPYQGEQCKQGIGKLQFVSNQNILPINDKVIVYDSVIIKVTFTIGLAHKWS